MRLVCGVGINDKTRPTVKNGRTAKEYNLWISMLSRCYSEDISSYSDCSVSDNFKRYDYFYDWCQNQIGFGVKDFDIDKDLLVKGNRVYSEITCCFIPAKINRTISIYRKPNEHLPSGVLKNGNLDEYRVRVGGKVIGYYPNIDEAFAAYKEKKEQIIRDYAVEHKSNIDPVAFDALMNWTIIVK